MKVIKKAIIAFLVCLCIHLMFITVMDIRAYHARGQKSGSKTENSKDTRILSVDNIATPITMEELFQIETSKEYTINSATKSTTSGTQEETVIMFANSTFFETDCKKEYWFYGDKLSLCDYKIETSNNNLYQEFVEMYGEPDESNSYEGEYFAEIYVWYGNNDTFLQYVACRDGSVKISFWL